MTRHLERRVEPTRHHANAVYVPPPADWWQRLRLAQRIRRGACGHLIWEFEALKATPAADVAPA